MPKAMVPLSASVDFTDDARGTVAISSLMRTKAIDTSCGGVNYFLNLRLRLSRNGIISSEKGARSRIGVPVFLLAAYCTKRAFNDRIA